jgi:hypothetical protein
MTGTAKEFQQRVDEAKILAMQAQDRWERETLLHIATPWHLVAAHKASGEAKQTHSTAMYSIYDKQLRRLMLTGRNSPTKAAAKSDLLHYLSADHTQAELAELSELTPDELAARRQCEIVKHLNPYPEDDELVPL